MSISINSIMNYNKYEFCDLESIIHIIMIIINHHIKTEVLKS